VVGSRVAGAASAMLLARAGLRVLTVDRTRFPSDAVSSHQIQVPGAALLNRWGLLSELVASGTPAATRARFDIDGVRVAGDFPTVDGVGAVYSPRRILLDDVLVRAAREAGAETREGLTVEELLWSSGRVSGIRGRTRDGLPLTERGTLVIGADGKHSTVARQVGALRYRTHQTASFASYGYWAGLPLHGTARMYSRRGLVVAAFPTNDELSVVFLARPRDDFDAYRGDVEAGFLAAADQCGDLGERLRAGHRVERIRTTPDLPHALTVQHGLGWALAGDAGAVMNPVTAQGITHALRDADRLTAAVRRSWPAPVTRSRSTSAWRRHSGIVTRCFALSSTAPPGWPGCRPSTPSSVPCSRPQRNSPRRPPPSLPPSPGPAPGMTR
jgi:2-polyprenyl-6-methoxyphenol hydroxylase-like FAD-dependent oxidoreductase